MTFLGLASSTNFYVYLFVFFFKQKTAYEMRISDWSSDVCSSDLISTIGMKLITGPTRVTWRRSANHPHSNTAATTTKSAATESSYPSAAVRATAFERTTTISSRNTRLHTNRPNGPTSAPRRSAMWMTTRGKKLTSARVRYTHAKPRGSGE